MILPFPTKTRLKLAEAIAARHIRHYPFVAPATFNDTNGRVVTAAVRLLDDAGLVEIPEPDEHNYSIVRLTPEGKAWQARATGHCERCFDKVAPLVCCSSHDKQLCHLCYRQTHVVEVCGCALCDAEGLPEILAEGPGSTSPEPGPECSGCADHPKACPAHGVHPHNGMKCLDCPECMDARLAERTAAESTKDGTE